MNRKGCDIGVYNRLSYRVCYGLTETGKMDYSKELYEFSKYCKCEKCSTRLIYKREPSNHITVTTDDKGKFSEAEEIIKSWECKSEKMQDRKYVRL